MSVLWKKTKAFYFRYERHISSLSLVGGFVFDALTLKRVDKLWENMWVLAHLFIAAGAIILLNVFERRAHRRSVSPEVAEESRVENMTLTTGKWDDAIRFWLIIIIQFGFGGLLSVFLVFYFRSATLAYSWPFLLVLAAAFTFNELLKYHYSRLVFQISMVFLSAYAFFIYFIPTILHSIGTLVFLLSGAISVFFLGLFLMALKVLSREQFVRSRKLLYGSIGAIIILINVFYFTNIIPPIPLSLKDSGVYHSISRNSQGNYNLVTEAEDGNSFVEKITSYFKTRDVIHIVSGRPIYVFSAVFSPTDLNTNIIHEWQYYDAFQNKWQTYTKTNLPVVGGREGGFRTYSYKSQITPGLWRVEVESSTGQHIGRINFEVVSATTTPPLTTIVAE